MKYIKGFFAFWYDFIVGDAWEVAAGVVAALIVLYFLLHFASVAGASIYAAVLFPIAIIALLAYSVLRVRKPR